MLDVIDDEFLWEAQMKWLTLSKEAKTIFFSHVIKTYKSKLLCSLQIIFFFNFCSQHMIASFITSVVVCIIDYNNNHQDLINSALYWIARKSISSFCRFRLSVDAVKSWRQLSSIWLCKIFLSFYSILLFHFTSLYEYFSDLIHSLLDLWKSFCWLKKFFTFYYFIDEIVFRLEALQAGTAGTATRPQRQMNFGRTAAVRLPHDRRILKFWFNVRNNVTMMCVSLCIIHMCYRMYHIWNFENISIHVIYIILAWILIELQHFFEKFGN